MKSVWFFHQAIEHVSLTDRLQVISADRTREFVFIFWGVLAIRHCEIPGDLVTLFRRESHHLYGVVQVPGAAVNPLIILYVLIVVPLHYRLPVRLLLRRHKLIDVLISSTLFWDFFICWWQRQCTVEELAHACVQRSCYLIVV